MKICILMQYLLAEKNMIKDAIDDFKTYSNEEFFRNIM